MKRGTDDSNNIKDVYFGALWLQHIDFTSLKETLNILGYW